MLRRLPVLLSRLSLFFFLLLACNDPAADAAPNSILASVEAPVVGVVDRGLDPPVIALANAWGGHCTGVLLASDVVLTARRCVVADPGPIECAPASSASSRPSPSADPATLHVYTQVPGAGPTWASVGAAVLTSNAAAFCGADVAVLILAWPVDGAVAALASESGIAEGSYVRTVGFGWSAAGGSEAELLREHLPVLDVSRAEFAVAEATCVAEPGAVAFDETTGEVVGVLSRWGSPCGGPDQFDVFTRADAFYSLIEDALAWEPALAVGGADGGRARASTVAHAKKPPTDVGASCASATDCGTGLCVSAEGAQYCSQTCAIADRCPTDYRCVIAAGGQSVCVEL